MIQPIRSLCLFLLLGAAAWNQAQAQCDATFTWNQPAATPCTIDPVAFSSNADPATVVSYQWNFFPGTSNQANPTHTFPFSAGGGVYSVTLMVTDTAGNICSTTQFLNLPDAPTILIAIDSLTKCIQNSPDTLFGPTFTIDPSSMGQGPFDWNFGDGTFLTAHPNQVVNHTYDCYGTFVVTVTANGQPCPGFQETIRFYTDPVSDLVLCNQPVFCEGATICAINKTDPDCNNVDYYIWDWGVFGTSYTVIGQDTQSYTFDLTNQDKCIAPAQGYVDEVRLTAVNQCFTHFSTTQITIRPAPEAAFVVPDTVCLPDGLAIFDNNTCPTDAYFTDPTDYFWEFGDGGTSILRDPIHDYTPAGPGIYTVNLFASNACGADTFSRDVVVVRAPIAAMIPDTNQGCAPFCMTFQNGTIPDSNEVPVHFQWNVFSDSAWHFGGGTNQNTIEPIICFDAPDTFLVQLIAFNLCGSDTTDTLIFVNIAPLIRLDTLADTCDVFVLDSLNYFLNDFGATISSYTWTTTGTPAVTNGLNLPQTTFGPGNHTITLSVVNECGVTSESISFVVDPLPVVDAGVDQTICYNDTVFLDGSPKPGFWTGAGIQQDSVFVPDTLGTYELIYTFEAPRCFAYDTLYITVIDTPSVSAIPDIALCEDSTITISLTATPLGGSWTGPNLINGNEFVADTPGTFLFTYTFVDSIGCPGRDAVVITVNPEPVVDIMVDTALFCLINLPQPLPPATPPGGLWSGTGVTDPLVGLFNPDSLGGPDTVLLTYTFVSDSGCTNFDSLAVIVVVADSVTGGPGATECYNFGLDTLSGNSPSNGVWSGGSYVVDPALGVINTLLMVPGQNMLIYTFAPGTSCETNDTTFYTILDTTAVDAGPDEVLCESTPAFVLGNFSPAGGSWTGIGIVNSATGEFDPALVPVGTSTLLTYQLANPNGCVSRDTKTILVDSLPTVAFLVDSAACTGNPVLFGNQSIYGNTWDWDFGDGNTSNQFAPTHFYTFPDTGIFTYELIATSINGCQDSLSGQILVLQAPTADFSLAPDSGCAPLVVTFTDLSDPARGEYFWDFGNGDTSILPNPPPVTYLEGIDDTTYYITLTITNACGSDTHTDSVVVSPRPQVSFGPAVNSGCSIFPVDFGNGTVGNPENFFWYLDSIHPVALFSTDTIPATIFLEHAPDTGFTIYTIYLIATNDCGADTGSTQITVYPNTVDAFFNTTPPQGCAPLTVQFTGLSGAPGFGWLIDGTQPTIIDPSYTFTQPGSYTVYHYANNGCSFDTNSIEVDVFSAPDVSFFPDTNVVCVGTSIQFTNTSLNTTGYNWDFGDNIGTSLVNPTHTYFNPATYFVTLTALSDTNACPNTFTDTITVLPLPSAQFAVDDTAGCPPLLIQTSGTAPNLNYFWNFGDNSSSIQQHPSHVYGSPGIYTLSLLVTDALGCENSEDATIRVFEEPTADFSVAADTVCGISSPLVFTNLSSSPSTPVASFWDFGDGNTSTQTNPSHLYAAPGSYLVKLVVSNPFTCADSIELPVWVLPQPIASLSIDTTQGCVPFAVSVSDLSTGNSQATWLIDGQLFSGSPINYTFLVPDTTYTIYLTADTADVCFDVDSVQVETASEPVSAFNPDQTEFCDAPATVQFTNLSTSIRPLTYSWTFGDGATSTQANPSHTYTAIGEYIVSLLVSNDFFCESISQDTIYVYPQPVASIGSDTTQGCVPLTVQFDNLSTGYSNWNWTIDGSNVSTLNPSYTYTVADTDLVVLMIDTAGFCFDTATLEIRISNPPTAAFSVSEDEFCDAPATVQFTDMSLSEVPLSYLWDFGDGNSSTLASPSHTYLSIGHFTVTQTITSDYGCVDVIQDTIYVYPQPVAAIGSDTTEGCVPLTVQFDNLSTGYSNWNWTIDGSNVSTLNPSHTYTVADTDLVVLMVDTAGFCFDTATLEIRIANPPTAAFSVSEDEFCDAPATVQFTDMSLSEVPLSYLWDFGDGNSSTLASPSHTYLSIGHFTVTQTITSDYGCVDVVQDTIYVYPQPVASIGSDTTQGCVPLTVQFDNLSTGYSNWDWTIDGSSVSTLNPSYTYTVADTDLVVLMVDTAGFCFDTATLEIRIANPPTAAFSVSEDEFCDAPATVQFTDMSLSEVPLSYLWDFGDGDSSTLASPSHTYLSIGHFTVTQTITSDYGCVDVVQDTIYVYPQPVASIGSDTTQGCVPLTVQFDNLSTGYSNWDWIIAGGPISTLNPNHTYTVADTDLIVLMVDTAGFCFDTATLEIRIATPPTAAFSMSENQFCSFPATVQFSDQTQSEVPYTHLWDFGDGTTSTNPNPAHTYFAIGHYEVLQVITTDYGCVDSLRDTVFVYPVPQAALVVDTMQGCVPFEVSFLDQSINATGWQWFVDGDTIFEPAFTHLFTSPPDTSFVVTLVADTAGFCFDTATVQIDIASPPLANFSMDWEEFCGVPALNAFTDLSQSTRPLQYRWEFGDAGSSVVPNPNHVYNATGSFVVALEIINDYNCRDTLTDTVQVYPIPEAVIQPIPQRGCTPLEVQFLNQSTNYTHSLWDFGDGSGNSLADSPTHLYTFSDTSFVVQLVVDTAGFCFDSATVQIDVASAPLANFDASTYEACGSARVQFTNQSFTADLPLSYVWDLGNGIISSLENPVTDYTSPGEYEVELVVRNSYECTDTFRQTITIYPQASAMFSAEPLQGCQPLEVQFTNLSSNATQWRWSMGDGAIRVEESFLHTYEQVGIYSVELISSFNGNCPDTIRFDDLIQVDRTPIADFVAEDSLVNGRPDGSVRFLNTTVFGDRYEWDFGDGSPVSQVPSPSHRYYVNETFTVRLVAWSAAGCSDTVEQEIMPLLFGDLHVPNALAPNGGPGEYSIFLPKGVGLTDYHIAVYSIWGDLVWESTELVDGQPAESWDGTIRGQTASSDVFVWKVHTAIFQGGRNWAGPREGSVTLIR